MPKRVSKSGSELFIVDNSDEDWKVRRYLNDWLPISKSIDIATGYFEIGALLVLNDEWKQLDTIRILMGDEVSKRTKHAFADGLREINDKLDKSIESQKIKDDFLTGAPAVVEAIRSGQIKCRVCRGEKFHAKAYITHAKLEVVGASALVGSSNFTYPGLTENIELNVQITGAPVKVLQEWYEEHWSKAEDVSPEVLKVIERHTRDYSPFDVYAKALNELIGASHLTDPEWLSAGPENGGSCIYPILDKYQQDGFHELLKISDKYNGAFLCDGVGLGKTYIGLMLIEYLAVRQRRRVVLLTPKSAGSQMWTPLLERYFSHLSGPWGSNMLSLYHTDLLRDGRQKDVDAIAKSDVVIIDEAHHFRNTGIRGVKEEDGSRQSRYWRLFDLVDGKKIFFLTATPVNNKLLDLQHMMELFTRHKAGYFADLGIHSLPGHFKVMEKNLEKLVDAQSDDGGIETNEAEAEKVLLGDDLFRKLVVQRSRGYVIKSQKQAGGSLAMFPTRSDPKVAGYSIKKVYGGLLEMIEQAFSKSKPLFALGVYYPLAYYKGSDTSIDPLKQGRQKEVVSLIRIQFLKRFESSVHAFDMSCQNLLIKLLVWMEAHCKTDNEKKRLTKWKNRFDKLLTRIRLSQPDRFDEDEDEPLIPTDMIEDIKERSRDEYKVDEIINDTFDDLNELAEFLNSVGKIDPKSDDKLQALIKLLKTDPVMSKNKVLIFTEFTTTARYLRDQLETAGFTALDEVDGNNADRQGVIRKFAPYYNGASSGTLAKEGLEETRILISTDVLAEGLNLQDSTRIINYDLHWNPVRLMQRIGRVDRRMSPEVEVKILADHPEQKTIRGKIEYWNFLPPEELDDLLKLYGRVAKKTLRISKTFGIEGKKLLKPDDDYEALKDFTHGYEGVTSPMEGLRLEHQALLAAHPELAARLDGFPMRVFSGKKHPSENARAVFFCYSLPVLKQMAKGEESEWTADGGEVKWYFHDLETGKIEDTPENMANIIRSDKETARHLSIPRPALSESRDKVEIYIKDTYLKKVNPPAKVKPLLIAWMELN